MINLQINNFEKEIVDLINNSELPVYIIFMVIRDIYKEIEQATIQQIINEQAQDFDEKGELYGKKSININLKTGETIVKEGEEIDE